MILRRIQLTVYKITLRGQFEMASGKRKGDSMQHKDKAVSAPKQVKLDIFMKNKKSSTKRPAGTKQEDFEYFWKEASPFSQFHPAVFTVDGVTYNCAEQYMMHQKALTFKDDESAKTIMQTKKPLAQKRLGRKVKNFDPKVWSDKCVDVVKKGNTAKFSQNSKLKEVLMDTYPRIMVEASPMDRIWGIGLAKTNKLAWNKATWRGKNLLGYALTDVRENLKNDKEKNKITGTSCSSTCNWKGDEYS